MACSVASDDALTSMKDEDYELKDIVVTDQAEIIATDHAEADSIPEDLPQMEQEVVISLPNSAATSVRAKPHPFSQINVLQKDYRLGKSDLEDDIIVDETIPIGPYELATQTTVLAQVEDEIGEDA